MRMEAARETKYFTIIILVIRWNNHHGLKILMIRFRNYMFLFLTIVA